MTINKKRYKRIVLFDNTMNVRDIAKTPIYKCCSVVGKYKYSISLNMLDVTPLVLFNNYWRQKWMDAVAWQDFYKT